MEEVSKIYGEDVLAVDSMSLDIKDGEFVVFVGPSDVRTTSTCPSPKRSPDCALGMNLLRTEDVDAAAF